MTVAGKEPYRSRADMSKATWGSYFAGVHGFTYDDRAHAPWVHHVDKAFAEEGTGRAHGMMLASLTELFALHPNAKWYLITDDDTFVVPHQLLNAAATMDHRRPILAGRCALYPPEKMMEFIVGGGGLLASRAFVEAMAPHTRSCRRKYNWHDYGDTRVVACGRDVFNHTRFVTCRQSEFFNDGILEANPQHQIDLRQRVVTMHMKEPELSKLLFRYLEREIAARRAILWRDLHGIVKAMNALRR